MTNIGSTVMRVRRSDNAVGRIIDGEVVVLVPEDAMLHALGGCGSRIWEIIETESSITGISKIICDEYDVESARAEAEVADFIHSLKKLNLVEIVTAENEEVDG